MKSGSTAGKVIAAFLFGLGLCLSCLLIVAANSQNARAAAFDVDIQHDENDSGCTPGDCSLREAIIAANTSAGRQHDAVHSRVGMGFHLAIISLLYALRSPFPTRRPCRWRGGSAIIGFWGQRVQEFGIVALPAAASDAASKKFHRPAGRPHRPRR